MALNHPEPPGEGAWGKNLTGPDFITNHTGRLGSDPYFETNPDQYERSNPGSGQHMYYPSHPYGE